MDFHCYVISSLGLLALMTTGSWGQSIVRGSCPDLSVVRNFKRRQFFGTWYVAAEYQLTSSEEISCKTLKYSPRNEKSIWVSESFIDADGKLRTGKDLVNFVDRSTGRLQARKKNMKITFRGKSIPMPAPNYLVVATDYDNYAVVSSCYEIDKYSGKRVHILTRKRKPDPRVVRKARKIINEEGLHLDELVEVDQSYCN